MIYRNRVKEALNASGFAFGTFVQLSSPEIAELGAASGFDFIILDMEHGSFGIDSLANMIRGVQVAGAAPIVRLPDDCAAGIMKALDAGAVGIYIPHVSNPEQAENIIRAARYAPAGTRGACPWIRATGHGVYPWKDHVEWSNQNVMVWLLVETLEGFKNFKEIIAVPGIDAVAFGAVDLSQAMGLDGQTDHPEVRKEIERAVNLSKEKHVDVKMGVFGSSPQEIQSSARRWADLGVRIFSSMSDRRILSIRWKETLSNLEALRRGPK